MGNGMNKVLPGLFVGSYRDSKDIGQLERYGITHVIAIHDSPKRFHPNLHYLMIMASDTPDQNLTQYFPICNDFIHAARLQERNVLIHCLAGMSRSVTVAVAYIMSVTNLNWQEALKVVRSGRNVANPNHGFQSQLQDFEMFRLEEERHRLKERFPSRALYSTDREECYTAINNFEIMLSEKTVCEGDCKKGAVCPTGVCRVDQKVMRRRPSQNSNTSLSSIGSASSKTRSCPASPRSSKYAAHTSRHHRQMEQEIDELMELPAPDRHRERISSAGSRTRSLSRSPSVASSASTNNRYCAPRGLFSYTTSAPPSLRSSRIDLVATPGPSVTKSDGTVINVQGSHSRNSSYGQPPGSPSRNNPNGKPPPSPKRSMKRFSAT